MSYLDRIRESNAHDLSRFRPFLVAGEAVGWVREDFVAWLTPFGGLFRLDKEKVELDPALEDPEARSAAVEPALRALAEEGAIGRWRNEAYPVAAGFADPPLMQIDRAAVPFFGIRAYGVHMNGFVREPDGLHMWIGRRARNKATYPGMLDNMVAGGQPVGLSLTENLVKECAEEANIPESLARQAMPVGAITYCAEAPEGLKPDVQFCFDLELPLDFVPENTDGELEDFYLWPIERVAETVRETTEFKFNCNLVIIDFLIRHGIIRPAHPDYVDLVKGLRS